MKLKAIRQLFQEREAEDFPADVKNRNALGVEIRRRVKEVQQEFRKASYNGALSYQFDDRLSDREARHYKTRIAEGRYPTSRYLLVDVYEDKDSHLVDEFCYRNFFSAVAKSAFTVYSSIYQCPEAFKKFPFDIMEFTQEALKINRIFLGGDSYGTSFGLRTADLYTDTLFMEHSLTYMGADFLETIYTSTLDGIEASFPSQKSAFGNVSLDKKFESAAEKALKELIKHIKYAPF